MTEGVVIDELEMPINSKKSDIGKSKDGCCQDKGLLPFAQ